MGGGPDEGRPRRYRGPRLIRGARAVGIFRPEDEFAAVMRRIQPGKRRRAYPADVQQAGWAGGKAGDNAHLGRNPAERTIPARGANASRIGAAAPIAPLLRAGALRSPQLCRPRPAGVRVWPDGSPGRSRHRVASGARAPRQSRRVRLSWLSPTPRPPW